MRYPSIVRSLTSDESGWSLRDIEDDEIRCTGFVRRPAFRTSPPEMTAVFEAAARLQELVPDAVLVGGTAPAHHAGHRVSLDDDHVVADLRRRFDEILADLEATQGWITARVRRPVLILGRLDGVRPG